MKTAYLSLGSNVGDREGNLRRALALLASPDLTVTRVSRIYETEPQDVRDQDWFLNLIAEIETSYFPMQLLARIGNVEREMGRKRIVAKGPRTIDVDIILFGNFTIDTPKLQIPHPRMADRRFVLEPLAELIPEYRHPVTRKTIRELLHKLSGQVARPWPGNCSS